MTRAKRGWEIVTTQQKFDAVKREKWFWQLVALARVVNCIRFIQVPLGLLQDEDSPRALRNRINSFLFMCALLVEGMQLIQSMNQYFGKMDVFRDRFKPLLRSKEAAQLLNSNMRAVRNRLVFHVEPEEVGAQLADMKLPVARFTMGSGETNEQVYYELADVCALTTFVGEPYRKEEPYLAVIEEQIRKTTDVGVQFLEAAEILIATVLQEQGWDMQDKSFLSFD